MQEVWGSNPHSSTGQGHDQLVGVANRVTIAPSWAAVEADASRGVINFFVLASDHGRGMSFFFPRKLVPTAAGMMLAVDNEAKRPDLSPQQADLTLSTVKMRPSTDGWTQDGTSATTGEGSEVPGLP